ncbi:MAG: anti-sigma factor family protein [Fimbriimonadales bacterium]
MRGECERLEPALHDWLEGWLADSEREVVEAHLRACPACRAKVDGWQAVGRALRGLPQLPAPTVPALAAMPEPRGVLRLAIALCVPTAAIVAALLTAFSLPPLEAWVPHAAVQSLTRPFTAPVEALWNQLQEVLSNWTVL